MTTKKLNSAYSKWAIAHARAYHLFNKYDTILSDYRKKVIKEIKEKAKQDFHHHKISKTKDSYLITNIQENRGGFTIYRLFNKELDKEYMETVNSFEMDVCFIEQTYNNERHIVIKCDVFGHEKALLFYDYESFKRFVLKREWLKLKDIG